MPDLWSRPTYSRFRPQKILILTRGQALIQNTNVPYQDHWPTLTFDTKWPQTTLRSDPALTPKADLHTVNSLRVRWSLIHLYSSKIHHSNLHLIAFEKVCRVDRWMYARIPHPSCLALWRWCIFPSPLRQTSRVGKNLRIHRPGSPERLNDPLKAMELLRDSLHTNSECHIWFQRSYSP